jgi:hypothetical protein
MNFGTAKRSDYEHAESTVLDFIPTPLTYVTANSNALHFAQNP